MRWLHDDSFTTLRYFQDTLSKHSSLLPRTRNMKFVISLFWLNAWKCLIFLVKLLKLRLEKVPQMWIASYSCEISENNKKKWTHRWPSSLSGCTADFYCTKCRGFNQIPHGKLLFHKLVPWVWVWFLSVTCMSVKSPRQRIRGWMIYP